MKAFGIESKSMNIMIQLLLTEDKDRSVKNYIVCPNCNIKIMYTKQVPYLCPMCQTDIPLITPYLNSLEARIQYHQSNF